MTNKEIVFTQFVQRDQPPHQEPTVAASMGDVFFVAASDLFVLVARAKQLSHDMDLQTLRDMLIEQVQEFERHLQKKNVRTEQILIAKYFICALLDDVIEYVWLEGQGFWRSHALLFYFFQENAPGDKVFSLIARLQQETTINIALLEFAYMVLLYGYQGNYRTMNQGYAKLLEKIDELYHSLNSHYGDFRKSLFIQARS